jgi:hypothetical protein
LATFDQHTGPSHDHISHDMVRITYINTKKSHETCIPNRIVLFSHSLSSHVDIDVLACRIELEYGIILVK